MEFIRQMATAADMTLVNKLMGNRADKRVKLTRGSGPQPTATSTIYYTTTDNTVYNAFDNASNFGTGVTLVSNTYSDGQGVVTYNGTVTKVADGTFQEEVSSLSRSKTYAEVKEELNIDSNGMFTMDGIEYKVVNYTEQQTGVSSWHCTVEYATTTNKLKSIVLPNTITTIGDDSLADNRTTSGAFSQCGFLESITMPSNLTEIKHFAFYSCSALTSVVLPSTLTYLRHCAFNNCTSLTSININDTQVTNIEEGSLRACGFTSINLPAGLTTIGSYALMDCKNLTSITIPEGVVSLPNSDNYSGQQFRGCTSLTTINLPSTLTTIGSQLIYGDTNLTRINYNGTTVQWNNITKASNWAEMYYGNGKIYCTDGDPISIRQ